MADTPVQPNTDQHPFEDPRWAEHGDPAFDGVNTHGSEPGPGERNDPRGVEGGL